MEVKARLRRFGHQVVANRDDVSATVVMTVDNEAHLATTWC
jgi:hypothetical protein